MNQVSSSLPLDLIVNHFVSSTLYGKSCPYAIKRFDIIILKRLFSWYCFFVFFPYKLR